MKGSNKFSNLEPQRGHIESCAPDGNMRSCLPSNCGGNYYIVADTQSPLLFHSRPASPLLGEREKRRDSLALRLILPPRHPLRLCIKSSSPKLRK
ncbi:hypothetical protein Bca4012_059860 [Brassica carinata]